jgi:hypothetical protein
MANELGKNAISFLQDEQNQSGLSLENQSEYEAPATQTKYNIYQEKGSNKWIKDETEVPSSVKDERLITEVEQKIIDTADSLYQVCVPIDQKIVSYDDQINAKKQQIVALSVQATNGNCWPGIAFSTGYPGIIYGTQSSQTPVYEDVDKLKIYPKIAGPGADYTAENPFDPDSIVNLTSAYAGWGYQNTKSDDGGNLLGNARYDISPTLSDHQPRDTSVSIPLGSYDGAGVAPYASDTSVTPALCVSIQNQIATLVSEISALRIQRDAAVNRTDLNAVKTTKSNKELQSWGIANSNYNVISAQTQHDGVIGAIGRLS